MPKAASFPDPVHFCDNLKLSKRRRGTARSALTRSPLASLARGHADMRAREPARRALFRSAAVASAKVRRARPPISSPSPPCPRAAGLRADVNLIDFDRLRLHQPEVVADLPAGGQRRLQRVKGYRATLMTGIPVSDNGEDTGARPRPPPCALAN